MPIRLIVLLVFVVFVAGARPATAQGPAAEPARSGPWVHVSPVGGGGAIKARLLELGPEEVTLLVDGQRQELQLERVARIEREGDSLKNGAIIGAVVLGAWCAFICGQAAAVVPAVAANATLGALIGAGIDYQLKGRTTIYPATHPAHGAAGARLNVAFRIRF
jgi:hypothetical protein